MEFCDRERGMVKPAFTMSQIQYDCGAPACLMALNAVLQGRDCADLFESRDVADDLGITVDQAEKLCKPEYPYADYFVRPGEPAFITKAHAVAVLRNLATTGSVEWKIGGPNDT